MKYFLLKNFFLKKKLKNTPQTPQGPPKTFKKKKNLKLKNTLKNPQGPPKT